MKKTLFPVVTLACLSCKALDYKDTIGQRYFDFISQSNQDRAEELFSPTVKKIINSKLVCDNRDQLISQMQQVKDTFGIKKIEQLELIHDEVNFVSVIRFEITWNDDTTESIISIIKGDGTGLITEINEVFGEKAVYEWHP